MFEKITLIDYSEKAIAIPADYDTALLDEFRAIGGRYNKRLAFGSGWIFSKTKHRAAVVGLLDAYGIEFAEVALSDIEHKPTSASTSTSASGLPDYIKVDKSGIIVTLDDGGTLKVAGSSDKLETRFCFGYSDFGQGRTYEEAKAAAKHAQTSEEYFITENLQKLRDRLNWLNGEDSSRVEKFPWLIGNDANQWELTCDSVDPENPHAADYLDPWKRNKYKQGLYKPVSDTDRERLIAAYNHALQLREKRCRVYLKRYGLSKLYIWTYCSDD